MDLSELLRKSNRESLAALNQAIGNRDATSQKNTIFMGLLGNQPKTRTSWINNGMFQKHLANTHEQMKRVELHKSCYMGSVMEEDSGLRSPDERSFGRQGTRPFDVDLHTKPCQLVISMPNPDYDDEFEERTIHDEEAGKIFSACFKGEEEEFVYAQEVNMKYEKTAFMQAFQTLDDHIDEDGDSSIREKPDRGRKWSYGGTNFINDQQLWESSSGEARDFLTLMRNVIVTNLVMHLGLQVKLMFSETGDRIYMLVSGDEENIKNEAERQGINMQLELGASDLESLQPCDAHLRPYRLLRKDPELDDINKRLKAFYSEIFAESSEMQRSASYGETEEEEEQEMLEPYNVGADKWAAYKTYLEEIERGLGELSEHNFEEDGTKALVNKHIIMSALEKANKEHPKAKLKTLWDRLGCQPMGAYTDYTRNFDGNADRYEPYWQKRQQDLTGKQGIFRETDKISLVYQQILRQVDLSSLQYYKIIDQYFPLHNEFDLTGTDSLQSRETINPEGAKLNMVLQTIDGHGSQTDRGLANNWAGLNIFKTSMPLDSIKDYFGIKIALYFKFLQKYTRFMFFAVIFGIITELIEIFVTDDGWSTFFFALYCIGIIIWSTMFSETWKQEQFKTSIQWGQQEADSLDRPEFYGYQRRSPVNDAVNETYFDPSKRFMLVIQGVFVSLIVVGIVLVCVAGLTVIKANLTGQWMYGKVDVGRLGCAFLNAFQIEFFNHAYAHLAHTLTEKENHKTVQEYESSLIVKTFLFQFVNSYNSIMYIAFFKTHVEGCYVTGPDGNKAIEFGVPCLTELQTQLGVIFTVHIIKNFLEVSKPWLKAKYRESKRASDTEGIEPLHPTAILRRRIDQQGNKNAYSQKDIDGTFGDYLELMIQFGFITLFAVGFPMAPFLAFINNLWEIKVDRFKLISLLQRPIPLPADSIGRWLWVLECISNAAIFTNAGILCFTLQIFDSWEIFGGNRMLPFVMIVAIAYGTRTAIQWIIIDKPERFKEIYQRHKYIVDKCIKGFAPLKKGIAKSKKDFNLKIHQPRITFLPNGPSEYSRSEVEVSTSYRKKAMHLRRKYVLDKSLKELEPLKKKIV